MTLFYRGATAAAARSLLAYGQGGGGEGLRAQQFDALTNLRELSPIDAIIINASGCGTTVKDYGHLFAHDPAYAAKAKFISSLAKDIAEFAAQQKMEAPMGWSDIRVAYHSACSMQHGQKLHDQPRQLLRDAGFTVAEIPEGHIYH